jgi:hypothetical protein
MRPQSTPLPPGRDRLDRIAMNRELSRGRFLAAALASMAVLALPGCQAPTFDPDTTTLIFRRRSYGGSGRN